jgi:catechol 2,3-dioxygenase-like lactoylglutathione lyase family enzyme
MRFTSVTLAGPPGLSAFYRDVLGLPLDGDAIVVGETRLRFEPGDDAAFYHFALLVPGDRFDAALAWAQERVEILADSAGERVFRTEDEWNSSAVYFHDPAGNILELIAHHGIEENRAGGAAFGAEELVGFSELGIVGDRRLLLERLRALGLELFRGTVDEPNRLGFVGELGRTFIVAPPGRGWVPTERPAEPHPVRALVSAPHRGKVDVGDGLYELTSEPEEQDARTKA